MAKRWYVTTVVNRGTEAEPDWHPKVGAAVPGWVAVYAPSGPDGAPSLPWCLVLAAAPNHAAALADADNLALPDAPLDAALSTLPNAERNRVTNGLAARGIAGVSASSGTQRGLLTALGRRLRANFDPDGGFDVADPSG